MSDKNNLLNRAILPVAAIVPLVAATLWVLTEEPTTFSAKAPTIPATDLSAPTVQKESSAAIVAADKAGEPAHATPDSLGEEPFASSLKGTEIDGALKADANGNLIVDLSTRDFFDYFLNTVGEVSPETALAEIEALARGSLPPAAAEQALAVLDQYLDYKQQALAMGNQTLDPTRQQDPAYQLQMLKSALTDLKQLRRNAFDPATHQAFFGLEEAYGDYTLATIEIQQRDDLSADSKRTLMTYHREQLPEVIRNTETRMIQEQEIHQQRQEVIANASSPEQAGEQLSEMGVPEEQVTEVVNYLTERERFDDRYQQFEQELASLQSAGLSDDAMSTQRDQLLEQHFDSEQSRTWARLKALDTQ